MGGQYEDEMQIAEKVGSLWTKSIGFLCLALLNKADDEFAVSTLVYGKT